MILGVHHIAIACADVSEYDAALKLYIDTFGFKILRQWGSGPNAACMIDAANTVIELFASGRKSDTAGPVAHLAFRTDSVDDCIKK